MSPLLQFIDTHVNKPFKDLMREKWETWMDEEEEELIASGNRRQVSYEMIDSCVSSIWKGVAITSFIIKGFHECCYLDWIGNYESLHSWLRATIVTSNDI